MKAKFIACVLAPLSFNEGECYNVRVFLTEHYIMVVKKHKGAVNAEKGEFGDRPCAIAPMMPAYAKASAFAYTIRRVKCVA